MTRKLTRFFWSYDVEKTEKWLEEMATNGYLLQKVNLLTRQFYFEKSEAKNIIYRIVYAPKRKGVLTTTLKHEGWQQFIQHRNWHVIMHGGVEKNIQAYPSREGIINRNRFIKYVFGSMLFSYLGILMIFMMMMALNLFLGSGTSTFVPSPYWLLTGVFGLIVFALFILSIYSVVKIRQTNQKLDGISSFVQDSPYELKPHPNLVIKRRLFWFEAPDTFEQWLENMEKKGYQLQHISKTGVSFYFKKGNPRTVSYCVDFQFHANKPYLDLHREAGWHLKFATNASILKWFIWAKTYEADSQKPSIYSDHTFHRKQARKVLMVNLLFSVPILALIYVMLTMNDYFSWNMSLFRWVLLTIYFIFSVIFMMRIVRSFCYYLRMIRAF